MDIANKFEQGKAKGAYQRIDANNKVNVYLGYNSEGHMSLVITENGKDTHLRSTKVIQVKMGIRKDGKKALQFNLLDDSFESMFLVFCRDIIVSCEKAGPDMAISTAILRWKYWKEMFGKKNNALLEKNEIKGLIGELLELKNYFIPKYGDLDAVSCWMGPLSGHKDFEINDTWYEIKSISEAALMVTISSLEQLDSDIDGHLSVYRLEETNSVAGNSINLNQIVASVSELISDPEVLAIFNSKLNILGYQPNPEYDNYNYIFKGMCRYTVNSQFPRLTRTNVDNAIGNVKYSILIPGIDEFKEI